MTRHISYKDVSQVMLRSETNWDKCTLVKVYMQGCEGGKAIKEVFQV
jgi:hypothetical protein